jgi:3-hydroxyisobutyrate dehydrogenase
MNLRVGFIGIGTMGRPMATNVAKAGFDLTVFDLREEPLSALSAFGATVARSPQEVGERSDVIEIAVVDDLQVEAVLYGPQGLFEGARRGAVVAIHSTVAPETVQKAAEAGKSKSITVLDAPVSGGQKGAEDRELCYMVGGDQETLEICRPVFSTSGAHIFHMGDLGSGSIAKIVLQVVVCVNMLAAHEAEVLCEATGIDLRRFLQVLHVSSGESFVTDNWIDRFKRAHEPMPRRQQRAEVFKKSLAPALELAERVGVQLPGARLAHMQLSKMLGVNET